MLSNLPLRDIAHFDLDSFFVSVECLKDTSLKGKPLIVGGSSDRGVVAACSYEARKFGVKSAMPVRLARRLCPDVMIIKGDMDSYSSYSRMVTDIIESEVPSFEKASIDEFYIDLSGMDKFYGCSRYTLELKRKVMKESGLTISYGLSSNKLVSKVATDFDKPNGQYEVAHGKEKSFLAPMRIDKLPMVGSKTSELLRTMGVEKIQTLSEIPLEMLTNLMGKNGIELWRRANGIDETPIVPYHEAKSIGTESTFDTDTINMTFLNSELVRMTERVAFELRSEGKVAGCITIKIRYSDFQTITKQAMISYTGSDHTLLKKAKELFYKLYDRRLLVRLLGIRLTHIIPGNHQINLFEDTEEMLQLYKAIDSVKHQFGESVLKRAAAIYKSEKTVPLKPK